MSGARHLSNAEEERKETSSSKASVFVSSSSLALPAVPFHIPVTSHTPESFLLHGTNLTWTGSSYVIGTLSGVPWYLIELALLSFSRKKTIKRITDGQALYRSRSESLKLRPKHYILDANGGLVYTVRRKSLLRLDTVYEVVTAAEERRSSLWVKCRGLLGRDFKVYDGETGEEVCRVSRRETGKRIALTHEGYVVDIKPGIEIALMLMVVLSTDEAVSY